MLGFMHRLAYSAGRYLRHKPAAIVTSARRAGTTTAIEAMERSRSSMRCRWSAPPLPADGPRHQRRSGGPGRGGLPDHAQPGHQHGLAAGNSIEAGKAASVEVPTAEGASGQILSVDKLFLKGAARRLLFLFYGYKLNYHLNYHDGVKSQRRSRRDIGHTPGHGKQLPKGQPDQHVADKVYARDNAGDRYDDGQNRQHCPNGGSTYHTACDGRG